MVKYKFEPNYWILEGEIDDPLEGEFVSAGGRFVPSPDGTYLEFPFCAHGDYLNGMVQRSNYEWIVEHYRSIIVRDSASYAFRNIYIREDILEKNQELKYIFERLEDYPLIDEDRYSRLQMETLEEDWDAWIKFDLLHELDSLGYEDIDDDVAHEVFNNIMYGENIEYRDENPYSISFDMNEVLEYWEEYWKERK